MVITTILAEDLKYPEGPVILPDESFVCSEVAAGRVTRLSPTEPSSREWFATGGSPAGCALGPDGAIYVCNGGGTQFRERDGHLEPWGPTSDSAVARIERIDLNDGSVTVLYDSCDGRPLSSPNDLVFDAHGGFYFTDFGRTYPRHRDRGAVYYAMADGSGISEVIYPLETPNGIGLSPDGRRLYVAETVPGRLWAFEVTGPGHVSVRDDRYARGELVIGVPGLACFDSLAVQADGSICVATLVTGGITRVTEDGILVEHIPLSDSFTTNICFGGAERTTAFITLSSTGVIVQATWDAAGLVLAHD